MTKIHDARYVSFPFELKDAFREVFPNAKWNPTSREWQVVKGSEQRLVDWVKEVEASGILQAMLDQETARLSEEEVLQLQIRLSKLKYDISIEENATERTANAKTRAEQLKEQLAGLEQQLHARKEANKLGDAIIARQVLTADDDDGSALTVDQIAAILKSEDERNGIPTLTTEQYKDRAAAVQQNPSQLARLAAGRSGGGGINLNLGTPQPAGSPAPPTPQTQPTPQAQPQASITQKEDGSTVVNIQ